MRSGGAIGEETFEMGEIVGWLMEEEHILGCYADVRLLAHEVRLRGFTASSS